MQDGVDVTVVAPVCEAPGLQQQRLVVKDVGVQELCSKYKKCYSVKMMIELCISLPDGKSPQGLLEPQNRSHNTNE